MYKPCCNIKLISIIIILRGDPIPKSTFIKFMWGASWIFHDVVARKYHTNTSRVSKGSKSTIWVRTCLVCLGSYLFPLRFSYNSGSINCSQLLWVGNKIRSKMINLDNKLTVTRCTRLRPCGGVKSYLSIWVHVLSTGSCLLICIFVLTFLFVAPRTKCLMWQLRFNNAWFMQPIQCISERNVKHAEEV